VQRGSIVKRSGSWVLLYYDTQFRAGQKKRVLVSKTLTRASKEYPTKESCRLLASEILSPINRRQSVPESSLPMHEFVDLYYFPGVSHDLKPSTLVGYKSLYAAHLKNRPELKPMLRDLRTVHIQRLLRSIDGIGHLTLAHVKNFLSGVFRWAMQEGFLDGVNPCVGVKVPGRPAKVTTRIYSISDCENMIEWIEHHEQIKGLKHNEDVSDVIALLSLTGLRQSECRGLRWSDWNENEATLDIVRAVWRTNVGRTKNLASEATIPLVGLVQELLQRRQARVKPSADAYIFAGTRKGAPLDLHNLANRVIIPGLKDSPIKWEGWHGFRRGLATNLLAIDTPPATIAKILRHSDPRITLAFYAKAKESESRVAMEKLEKHIRERPTGVIVDSKET
jgi:integrase